jgi:hypothetical protein
MLRLDRLLVYFHKIHLNDIKTILIKITKDKSDVKQLYNDIPYQKEPTLTNPIETNIYQIINNNLCNFCCFMDYSPDDVLTHFTESQKRIMHYFIIIFKSYLIKNSKKLESKLINNKIKYFINQNIKKENELIIEYNIDNIFEYEIIENTATPWYPEH